MKRLFLITCALLCASIVHADLIKQSSSYHRMVLMTLASDHVSGATGLTLTVTESKAGAAFGAATPTVTERGSGWYDLLLTSADDATLGSLAMHITGAAADPTDTLDQVVAFDPTSATNLGLSALPTAAPAASGGLITVGTGTGQLNPNGSGGLNGPTVVQSGTAQSGTSTTIRLSSGASAIDDIFKGNYVLVTGNNGAGQARTIIAYNGTTKDATISRTWTSGANPDGSSTYVVIANPHPALDGNLAVVAASVTGNVGGNVTGSVGSVTGNVGGSVASVTGNVGGNVVGSVASVTGAVTLTGGEHTNIAADILNAAAASYNTVNTIGAKINAAGGASDPWATALPGAYGAGTAGNIVGNRLDAAVSSRLAGTALPLNFGTLLIDGTGHVSLTTGEHTAIAGDVLNAVSASYLTSGSVGAKIAAAASAGDPLTNTAGNYSGSQLGAIIGKLLFDGAGNVRSNVYAYNTGLSPKEQVINLPIPGETGVTFGQALYAEFLQTSGKFGAPVRATSAPWTITVPFNRSSDGVTVWSYTTTYTDSTFSKTLSRTYTIGTLPSP